MSASGEVVVGGTSGGVVQANTVFLVLTGWTGVFNTDSVDNAVTSVTGLASLGGGVKIDTWEFGVVLKELTSSEDSLKVRIIGNEWAWIDFSGPA